MLGPSALLRRWRIAAAALSAALAAVLFAEAAIVSPMIPLLIAGAANAAAAAWIVFRTVSPARGRGAVRVRVDSDGSIRVRTGDDGPDQGVVAAGPMFVSTQVLVLAVPGGSIAAWRDALAKDDFRRIAAAARWPKRQPPSADDGQAPAGIA